MKSIRRSLVVSILLLLVLALGAVSGLVYETTCRTLQAREQTQKELLQQQYEERRDAELLASAKTLVNLTQSQWPWQRIDLLKYSFLGVLSAGSAPYGHVTSITWVAESQSRPSHALQQRLARGLADIQINEDLLPGDGEHEYAQINGEWGNVWRSRSLAGRNLPFDRSAFSRQSQVDWQFDDLEMSPGLTVRRVVFKSLMARLRVTYVPPPRRGPGRPTGPQGPQPPFPESVPPNMIVQVAWDLAHPNAVVQALQADHAQQVAALEAETRRTLDDLRRRLLWVSLATFAVALVGGLLLIGVGMAPLRRLGDAVSQVSEKDFHLPLDARKLPRELVPIADRLQHTLQQLRLAFEREKQATADISHELRTPVAALLTTLDVALRKPRSAEEYRETLADCRVIGKQMSHLVERILALARLDSGTDRVRTQSVDAAALAAECMTIVRPLAEAAGLAVKLECQRPAPVTTDPDKLREVLTNLLHNAVEYNRAGGRVEMGVFPEAGGLRLEVRDTGIGIAAEARERIFERFYRVDPSRTGTGLHAGLGLAIVKEYVTLLGGQIAVESRPGEGSLFRVTLPTPTDR